MDYRGYGGSTGAPTERGIYVDADATVAVFNSQLRRPDIPVVFWGRSLGAPVAASATGRSRPDALVLESPFPDVASVFRGNPVMLFFTLFSSYRFPTLRLMERYDGPLLVIHGERDTLILAGARVFRPRANPAEGVRHDQRRGTQRPARGGPGRVLGRDRQVRGETENLEIRT
jgi:fermentation-respiration switch protein FrsA (DUF1100 family)